MTKRVNAEQFRKRPHDVYSRASSGETVIINHDRYRDVVFILTSRPRRQEIEGVIDEKNDEA